MAKAAIRTEGRGVAGPFLILFALAAVFLLSLIKIYDYDVWFHLKTGEYILSSHVIPKNDVFSYTAAGKEWVTHEWLFEVIIQLVYLAAGLKGLTLFKASILTFTFGVGAIAAYRRGVSAYIVAPVAVLAAVISQERFLERPELLSFLFVTIYIAVLERLREDGTKAPYLWAIPAVMFIWGNSHAGAIFGLVIIGAYGFAETLSLIAPPRRFIERLKGEEGGRLRKLILIFIASCFAGLINPNTYHVFTYPFLALKISKETGLHLAEYNPPTWALDRLFFVSFAVSALILLLNIKRLKMPHVLIFILFSYSAFKFSRSTAFWAITVFPVIAYYADSLAKKVFKPVRGGALHAVLAAAAIAIMTVVPVKELNAHGNWGLGVKERWVPEQAIRFIERQGITGNMYNSYEYGGYILWRTFPERRVFLDGRSDIYTDVIIDEKVLSALGFENLVEKYGINYGIFSYNPSTAEYINPDPYFGGPLALVYWDDIAMVYVKRSPSTRPVIERYEYVSVRPTDLNIRVMDLNSAGRIIAELERNIRENPDGWRNHMILGGVFERLGDREKADREYALARANIAR